MSRGQQSGLDASAFTCAASVAHLPPTGIDASLALISSSVSNMDVPLSRKKPCTFANASSSSMCIAFVKCSTAIVLVVMFFL